jgi:hypothetical protein
LIKTGISCVKNIAIGENKKKKAVHHQKHQDGEITREAAEKLPEFFFTNRPHK